MEADHSDEVRLYMKRAEQQLDRMFKRLHDDVPICTSQVILRAAGKMRKGSAICARSRAAA
jgi:hypothetical protein